jgi:hypothetical protein
MKNQTIAVFLLCALIGSCLSAEVVMDISQGAHTSSLTIGEAAGHADGLYGIRVNTTKNDFIRPESAVSICSVLSDGETLEPGDPAVD